MHRQNEIHMKKSNQQQIGICHRLYNFLINIFFSPTLKNITIGHPLESDNDHQMLLQDQSKSLQESSLVSSPEIMVEFRHDIDSDKRIHIDETTRVDIMKPQEVQETKHREDFEVSSANIAKGKGPKTVSINENAEEYREDSRDKQQEQKDKNIFPVARDEAHKPPVMKKHRIQRLFSVETNINEKSDAFIRSKKAAMRRTYSHDVKDS
ncbi:hypothetical protein POM88_008839 [Heracleum sosnowskyi]|uniref:Uncharacterized protein n=1 Tax=Heracleum sosnowskyi TaxID=360622 RepID=A0AAD8J880_9APIA|nr:hypothetical protein POM88_008839 [Heracleum sosnowskyi]